MAAAASADVETAVVDLALTFRDLRDEDLPEVMELHRALFPVQYNETFYRKLFMPGYYCQVGVITSGEIVTVASARTVIDAVGGGSATDSPEAYIMTLGVRDTYRRSGLGSLAMEQILRLLRAQTRCEYAALHVKTANEAAVRFYDRMGFTVHPDEGLLREHYLINGQRWDAYRYTRSLRTPWTPIQQMVRDYCVIL